MVPFISQLHMKFTVSILSPVFPFFLWVWWKALFFRTVSVSLFLCWNCCLFLPCFGFLIIVTKVLAKFRSSFFFFCIFWHTYSCDKNTFSYFYSRINIFNSDKKKKKINIYSTGLCLKSMLFRKQNPMWFVVQSK